MIQVMRQVAIKKIEGLCNSSLVVFIQDKFNLSAEVSGGVWHFLFDWEDGALSGKTPGCGGFYFQNKYVIELKRWYGEKAHQAGLVQLSDYLDREHMKTGFLLIFEHKKEKSWRQEWMKGGDKEVFGVWVWWEFIVIAKKNT